jgi:hypothetical protein
LLNPNNVFSGSLILVSLFLSFLLQAVTIHCQSYVNKMTIILAVDPNVVLDPHQLLDDLEESLQIIKDAALKRSSSKVLLSEKQD